MVKKWIYLATLILVLGCTSEPEVAVPEAVKSLENVTVHPPDTEPAREIVLEEEVTYEDTKEVARGRIWGNIMVDSRGRVYIPDFQAKTVHAYNADGSYLDSIGRQGRGPGEFQMIWKLRVAYGNLRTGLYFSENFSI